MRAMIRIISLEGKYFDIPEQVIYLFPKIAQMINEDQEVILTEVNPDVLPLVIQWALRHLDDPIDQTLQITTLQFKNWDFDFLEQQHPLDLMEMIVASHYLGCTPLRTLAARRIGDIIKSQSAEENKHIFGSRAQELLNVILTYHSE